MSARRPAADRPIVFAISALGFRAPVATADFSRGGPTSPTGTIRYVVCLYSGVSPTEDRIPADAPERVQGAPRESLDVG